MTGSITHIDGNQFARAIISGIHQLISEQDLLNRINVFPVADGDTGTNMSLSLGYALPLLNNDEDKHLGTLLARLADALLDGARGNSGAIIAQFFQGMSDFAGERSRFTTYTFGKAVETGSEYARDALSDPREGTILSVIATLAASLRRQSVEHDEDSFSVALPRAIEQLETALAGTTEQLESLRRAGVVDAGAKGFVALMSGFTDALVHGRVHAAPDLGELLEDVDQVDTGDEESAYRFCTECIVQGQDIDRRKLRESLARLGDSLVLAGTKRKAKIHIHVDDPEAVFELARDFGEVVGEKADDMHRQQHSSHDARRSFAVVVDSGADVPDELLEKHDIHIVPLRVQFGERSYLDKVSISPDEFFTKLASSPVHPTTSQPAPGDFRRPFQFLASHYRDVLSINLTGRVSGTLQAAESAAERVEARGRIHVLDSLSASTGQGLLAVRAAEMADAGIPLDEAIATLETLRARTQTFAILNHLQYAVRGGRVPGWVRVIADALRMTAILKTTADGRVAPAGFLVGRRDVPRRFARYVAKRLPAGAALDLAIGHAIAPQAAERLADALREQLPRIRNLTITELGTAIGVHGGPGTLVVSAQTVDAAEED